jgi:1-acyl-sn-glycerol-3-phosphate acyltransferase
MCAILSVRRDVLGNVPSGGAFLVAANHLSYLDILVLGSLYPSLFLAKREIASWPLFGWVAKGAGTLFIDREQAKDVVRAGREMSERLELGLPLTIFPEGRSSRGVEILPFQPSLLEPAARAGVPCFAASISYETPGAKLPPSRTICWHDSESLLTHFPADRVGARRSRCASRTPRPLERLGSRWQRAGRRPTRRSSVRQGNAKRCTAYCTGPISVGSLDPAV